MSWFGNMFERIIIIIQVFRVFRSAWNIFLTFFVLRGVIMLVRCHYAVFRMFAAMLCLATLPDLFSHPAFAKPSCYRSVYQGHGKWVRVIDKKCQKRLPKAKNQKVAAVKKKDAKPDISTKRQAEKRKRARQLAKDIMAMQKILLEMGYPVGKPDGMMGRRTRQAMKDYAKKKNMKKAIVATVLARLVQEQKSNNDERDEDGDEGEVPGEVEYAEEEEEDYAEEDPGPAEPEDVQAEDLEQQPASDPASSLASEVLIPKAATPTTPEPQATTTKAFQASARRGMFFVEQCKGCHSFKAGDGHRSGPNLHGIMGRVIGSAPGFRYSEPFKFQRSLGIVWNGTEMECFLKGPEDCKPGTTMGFYGIKSKFILADIIAYLKLLK